MAAAGVYSPAEHGDELLAMCRRALELVEKGSLDEAAVVAQIYTWEQLPISREERWRGLERALRTARREHARGLEIEVLAGLYSLSADETDHAGAGKSAGQQHALARREGDLRAQCGALASVLHADLAAGMEVEESRHHVEAMLSAVERLRDRTWLGEAYFECERMAWRAADWVRARELCDRCLCYMAESPRRVALLNHSALVYYQTGCFDEGDRALAQALEAAEPLRTGLALGRTRQTTPPSTR